MNTILFRRTPYNRNSLAALIGYLRLHPPGGWRTAVAGSEPEARERFPTGPACVAFSFTTWQAEAACAEADSLRPTWTRTRFLAGGPHPSGDPQAVLERGFDHVFTGEGESSLRAFLEAGAEGPEIVPPGPLAPLEADTFLPEFGLTPPLELTRGCRHACCFCQTPALFGAPRHRDPDRVLAHARAVTAAGRPDLRFVSPDAFGYLADAHGRPHPEAVRELLDRLAAVPGARVFFGSFPSEIRPEHCLAEWLGWIRRRARNRRVVIGAQSGSPRLLAEMGRGHGVAEVVSAACAARVSGLVPVVDFIFGLPGETDADREATRALMRELAGGYRAVIRGHAFLPLPGSAWAGRAPGRVDEETARLLEDLEHRGRAEGHWREQGRFAAAGAGAA